MEWAEEIGVRMIPQDKPKLKIVVKFPMSNVVMFVDGSMWRYYFKNNRIEWVNFGSSMIKTKRHGMV